MFIFILWLISHESLYSHTIFLWCGISKAWCLEFIKRRSKVQKNNMPCERALNSDQWKPFSGNYKLMRIWSWLVYKCLLSLAAFLRVHLNSKEVSYLSWQNPYPNLKTTCHIKLKFFLWAKLLENFTPCKISHICRCAFKDTMKAYFC